MRARRADAGVVTAIELLLLLPVGLVALLFVAYVGRLHSAGVQVQSTAQAASRAASMASDPRLAERAADEVVAGSTLGTRCDGALSTALAWDPAEAGTWRGGSVSVTITCTVRNESLAGVWTPGERTIVATDTQPVDRYQR